HRGGERAARGTWEILSDGFVRDGYARVPPGFRSPAQVLRGGNERFQRVTFTVSRNVRGGRLIRSTSTTLPRRGRTPGHSRRRTAVSPIRRWRFVTRASVRRPWRSVSVAVSPAYGTVTVATSPWASSFARVMVVNTDRPSSRGAPMTIGTFGSSH